MQENFNFRVDKVGNMGIMKHRLHEMATLNIVWKGDNTMVNTQLLDEYIENSGLKVGFIVEKLGISRQGFDKKRKGITPFRASEIYVLCDLCRIPDLERPKIFC